MTNLPAEDLFQQPQHTNPTSQLQCQYPEPQDHQGPKFYRHQLPRSYPPRIIEVKTSTEIHWTYRCILLEPETSHQKLSDKIEMSLRREHRNI